MAFDNVYTFEPLHTYPNSLPTHPTSLVDGCDESEPRNEILFIEGCDGSEPLNELLSIEGCDGSEPHNEVLFTDSDEDYDEDNDLEKSEDCGYSEEEDEISEEGSEPEINQEDGETSAAESDLEEAKTIDFNKQMRGKKFEYDRNGKVHLECFMFFVDVNEFRSILRDYIIQENFYIIRVKNEKVRVTAIYASNGCPWRIHASPTPDGKTFMIKSYNSKHTCIRQSKKTNATSTWMAEKLRRYLSVDPNMSYDLMSNELNSKYDVEAHYKELYRAKKRGREEIEGSHAESYKKISKYAELLLEKNRGSVVKLNYHDRPNLALCPVFKRMFVYLDASKDGFLKGCRPFLGLDGCHLKGPYGGVLLRAISLDANNGLFPIAFAMAETESRESWSFFLDCLHQAI